MTNFYFTFLSQESLLLGIRFSKSYSFNEEGEAGPNMYTLSIGFIFLTLGVSHINLNEEGE
jgi:hypothetical protein